MQIEIVISCFVTSFNDVVEHRCSGGTCYSISVWSDWGF